MSGLPDPKQRRKYTLGLVARAVNEAISTTVLSGIRTELALSLEKRFGLPAGDAQEATALVLATLEGMGIDLVGAFMKDTDGKVGTERGD